MCRNSSLMPVGWKYFEMQQQYFDKRNLFKQMSFYLNKFLSKYYASKLQMWWKALENKTCFACFSLLLWYQSTCFSSAMGWIKDIRQSSPLNWWSVTRGTRFKSQLKKNLGLVIFFIHYRVGRTFLFCSRAKFMT